jgi:N-hydroxyarylamine O-acetyltransferase
MTAWLGEAASVDLDAYFRRVGYEGDAAPTLAVLRELHRLHTEAIPFENLSPLAGEPVRLDPASLERKLVAQRRGGYCYEHNLLFASVLATLGFDVQGLAARVRIDGGSFVPIRGHMLLLVDLQGSPMIADVGFGGLTLTAPLALVPDLEQTTPHELFRLRSALEGWLLEARIRGEWRALYSFDLQRQFRTDYEMASWYTSHYPESKFVRELIAARPVAGGRHALRNDRYQFHSLAGEGSSRRLESPDEAVALLEQAFAIDTRAVPGLRERIAGIFAAPSS